MEVAVSESVVVPKTESVGWSAPQESAVSYADGPRGDYGKEVSIGPSPGDSYDGSVDVSYADGPRGGEYEGSWARSKRRSGDVDESPTPEEWIGSRPDEELRLLASDGWSTRARAIVGRSPVGIEEAEGLAGQELRRRSERRESAVEVGGVPNPKLLVGAILLVGLGVVVLG